MTLYLQISLFVIILAWISGPILADRLSKEYKYINSYLSSKEQSNDLETNFELVEDLLDLCPTGRSCFSSSSISQRSISELIELYDMSTQESKCSPETLALLIRVKHNAGFHADWCLYSYESNRIASLVKQIGSNIAEHCDEEKARALKLRLASLDKDKMKIFSNRLKHYEQTLAEDIKGYGMDDTEERLNSFVITKLLYTDPTKAISARETIKKIAAAAVGNNLPIEQISKRKLRDFVKSHYINLCDYYVENTRDIMEPLREFIGFRDDQESEYISMKNFYLAIGRYNWCAAMRKDYTKIFSPNERTRIKLSVG